MLASQMATLLAGLAAAFAIAPSPVSRFRLAAAGARLAEPGESCREYEMQSEQKDVD